MLKSELTEFLNDVEGDPEILFLTGHGDTLPTQYDIHHAEEGEDGVIYLYSWINDPAPHPLSVTE